MSVYFYSGLIYKSGVLVRGFSGLGRADNADDAYHGATKAQLDVIRNEGIVTSDYLVLINQFNKVE